MTTIEKIFEFDIDEIQEACIETDSTFIELLGEVQSIRHNKGIPTGHISTHTTVWINQSATLILDWLEENRPKSKIEEETAEAEYRADAVQDEKWLRELTA